MKFRPLYLSIGLILALTLLFTPYLLGHQTVIDPYALTGASMQGDTWNIFLGVLVMIGGLGVATFAWLYGDKDQHKQLSLRQYVLGAAMMLTVGWLASWATAWAYDVGLLKMDTLGFYAWNALWYMPAMLATMITGLMFQRHVITGSNGLASWARGKTHLRVPEPRIAHSLPSTRVSSVPA